MHTLLSMLSSSVVCVLLAGVAAVMFVVLYHGARLTPEPWYVGEHVLGTVLVPLVVMLLIGAVGGAYETAVRWESTAIDEKHLPEAGLLALLFAGICLLLRRMTPQGPVIARRAKGPSRIGPTNGPRAPDGQPPRPHPVNRAA